jgi:chromosome segregation ATPase
MPRTQSAPDAQPARPLTVGEIRDLEKQQEQLTFQLGRWREDATGITDDLTRLCTRKANAEKFLSLTETIPGYSSERAAADNAIEDYAEQYPDLQKRLDVANRRIADLEQALKKIDTSALRQGAMLNKLASSF